MASLSGAGFTEDQISVLSKKGIKTGEDLLFFFPVVHVDLHSPLNLRDAEPGSTVSLLAQVLKSEERFARRRRLEAVADVNGFRVDLVFFHAIPWYRELLKPGRYIVATGKLELFKGHFTMSHPSIEIVSQEELQTNAAFLAVYHITDQFRKVNLTSAKIRDKIRLISDSEQISVPEYLSPQILQQYNLPDLKNALREYHLPKSRDTLEAARRRIALEELLFFSAVLKEQKQKKNRVAKAHIPQSNTERMREFFSGLPFTLTNDQINAINTISEAAKQNTPFSFLLQGDVGSGKTIVALSVAMLYIFSGYQVAIMAPTEILAKQHYSNFINFLAPFAMLRPEILTGSDTHKTRLQKLDLIKRGDINLVVGTHSLIQDGVVFHSLSLAVIDEQHRFGVEQREKLRKLGSHPDLIAMTATPIPRSLALAIYGDLEPVIIREKPPGRIPIDTRLFPESDLSRVYLGVKKYVNQGRQAYIIYPAIEESESVASLVSDFSELESAVFPEYRLGLLHGKLSSAEKDNAMRKFKDGSIQILVSTTVVEVGVDVPNATVIVIRNAERFGLAQLHQLRGRVGRGGEKSFCILVHSNRLTPEGGARLAAMTESDDGFFLAQRDLEIRGAGEVTGVRQSGGSEFRVADLRFDYQLIEIASDLIDSDPALFESIRASRPLRSVFRKSVISN